MGRYDIATGDTPEELEKPETQVAPGLIAFGPNSNVILPERRPFFRVIPPEIPRIAFMAPDPDHMFVGMKMHWAGQYIQCKNDVCCQRFGKARWRLGTVIFRYDTVLEEASPTGSVFPWIFNERTYNTIRKQNQGVSLQSQDYNVHCVNVDWMTIELQSGGKTHFNPAVFALYAKDYETCFKQASESLANNLSIEEIAAIDYTRDDEGYGQARRQRPTRVNRGLSRSELVIPMDRPATQPVTPSNPASRYQMALNEEESFFADLIDPAAPDE